MDPNILSNVPYITSGFKVMKYRKKKNRDNIQDERIRLILEESESCCCTIL